jgi:hypothetical protein
VRAVAAHPAGRAVLDFLPQLLPAWWVLRGYLAVQLASVLLNSTSLNGGTSFPVPSLFGSRVLGLLVTAGAVVGSVALARREPTSRRARRGLLLGNFALAVFSLVFLGSLASSTTVTSEPAYAQGQLFAEPGLRQDGSEISNIFPFDAQGRPLRDVYLVDQDGNAIVPTQYDHTDLQPLLPVDSDGNPIANRFPQRQVTIDPMTGTERPAPTPGFQPPPTTAPAPSTTTAPTTTTGPTTTTRRR